MCAIIYEQLSCTALALNHFAFVGFVGVYGLKSYYRGRYRAHGDTIELVGLALSERFITMNIWVVCGAYLAGEGVCVASMLPQYGLVSTGNGTDCDWSR